MKKLLLSLLAFTASTYTLFAYDNCPTYDICDHFDARSTVGFESEFVFRGAKLAQTVSTPAVEIGYNHERARFYVGAWNVLPADNLDLSDAQQVNPYAGIAFDVTNVFTLDGGFTYYWFTNTDAGTSFRTHNTNRQREVYLGMSANVYLEPSIYCFYNFDLQQWVIEPSLSESFDLEPWVCLPFSFDFGAHGGYLYAFEFNGNQRLASIPKQKNKYWYMGGKLELVYHFNDYASFGFGPRIAYNTDRTLESAPPAIITANSLGGHRLMFWWGANLSFNF